MTRPVNQLILMSDEHTRHVLGCYGNGVVQTPNLDRLAARGTVFKEAYTPVPICVPARASFATGLYGHATGHWDNATPYTGTPRGWGHAMQDTGRLVGSIGKLHYRNGDDPVGLDFQEIAMHVVNGVGDVLGCVREPLPKRWKSHAMAENIGPGETSYTEYDRNIAEAAAEWITARKDNDEPWTLFVSMVAPHFPLVAPQEFYDLYADRVLDALDAAGLSDSTQVIYTSDHGDNIGERGLWGKSNMFEESAGIPLIAAGPGLPEGHRCKTPASLVDLYPTLLVEAGIAVEPDRPGTSLVTLANRPDDPERVVFSEYHAMGAASGAFMIRKGRWKLVHYVGMPPELYDLADDPAELTNLGEHPSHEAVRADLMAELMRICDPQTVNSRALADQRAIVAAHGGAEAVVAKGGFGATPPPGEKPAYIGA